MRFGFGERVHDLTLYLCEDKVHEIPVRTSVHYIKVFVDSNLKCESTTSLSGHYVLTVCKECISLRTIIDLSLFPEQEVQLH